MCVTTQSKTVSGAYVLYADANKHTSENGQPVSAQVLSDSLERLEEEVVAEEEEAHLDIEEEAEPAGDSGGPVLEVIAETEKEVESLVGELEAELQWEPEEQEDVEEDQMETVGAKTKADVLDSPKHKRDKKMKAAPVLEVSNLFEVLGTLGAGIRSPIVSPGTLEIF